MRKVCLTYSQNNSILLSLNMANTILRNSQGTQRYVGSFFLDCAFRILIGWADKLRPRGVDDSDQLIDSGE